MQRSPLSVFFHLLLLAALSACAALPIQTATPTATALPSATSTPSATATPSPTATLPPTATPSPLPPTVTPTRPAAAGELRMCAYVPGVSTPAKMPPEVLQAATPTAAPTPGLPANSTVAASVTEQQLITFRQVWDLVDKYYVYRDFNGLDWKAAGEQYEALIQKGLAPEDFYFAMSHLIASLGDEHSAFLSPEVVKDEIQAMRGKADYVGIGAYVDLSTIPGTAIVTSIMAGSPAEEVGLLPHDSIVAVDGGPVLDEVGLPRTLGPENSALTISVQTPGQPARDIPLVRRRITSQPKVDFCLVPGTRVGYIRWISFADTTVVSQTVAAIQQMTASQPLDGLILDNRHNSGGLIDVLKGLLALFTKGQQGEFISGQQSEPLTITPQDLNGSQSIPLVVLIGPNTHSAGEYVSGLLQLTDGARLVGQSTGGQVEVLSVFDLEDGSRLQLAVRTFQPVGLTNNAWDEQGVTPDVVVPERWDLFTEANDPAIAKAVEILLGK